MFGNSNGAPSGPVLLLRSLGLDPEAIGAQVEHAKATALEVMQHFDVRLQALEKGQDAILAALKAMAERDRVQ
jgi:hypothetical protein